MCDLHFAYSCILKVNVDIFVFFWFYNAVNSPFLLLVFAILKNIITFLFLAPHIALLDNKQTF